MRISEIRNKQVINVFDGSRLGHFGDMDITFNPKSGKIIAFELNRSLGFGIKDTESIIIPWTSIAKFGKDMILVELSR